jgi:hypothetical protein
VGIRSGWSKSFSLLKQLSEFGVLRKSDGAKASPLPCRLPRMTRDLEVKVLCVSRPRRALAKRKVMSREASLKEARSKPVHEWDAISKS